MFEFYVRELAIVQSASSSKALIKRYVPEFAHGEDYIISFAIPDGSMIKD